MALPFASSQLLQAFVMSFSSFFLCTINKFMATVNLAHQLFSGYFSFPRAYDSTPVPCNIGAWRPATFLQLLLIRRRAASEARRRLFTYLCELCSSPIIHNIFFSCCPLFPLIATMSFVILTTYETGVGASYFPSRHSCWTSRIFSHKPVFSSSSTVTNCLKSLFPPYWVDCIIFRSICACASHTLIHPRRQTSLRQFHCSQSYYKLSHVLLYARDAIMLRTFHRCKKSRTKALK